jgi:magnesium transporter
MRIDPGVGVNHLVTVHGPNNPAVSASAAERETRVARERLGNGRLRPASPAELSHAIVASLIRNQEEYVELVTPTYGPWNNRSPAGGWTSPRPS